MSLREPTTLDDLLNYRLLRLFALGGAPVVRLLEGRYGIARREWRLLALLAARGPMSPSALAEAAQLDRPRTSRAAGVLAAKGLVQRQAQSGDARRAVLTLTESGHQLHDDLFPQIAAINARLVAVLDDAQLAVLDQALAQLTAHARQLNTELAQDVRADRRAGGSRRIRP
ncbi:MarR family transcriptional regulator [Ideonella sp. 3Y2]|uniref:MarR family transcriptional regulator n=1 Tax=Ideonella alba TaxID=2824118 RepID=A0A941BCW4_9BURK|nr:MarR family transcriptional regulator [Ideonella alba]